MLMKPHYANCWYAMSPRDRILAGAAGIAVTVFIIFFALIASGGVGLLIVKSNSMQRHMPAGSLLIFQRIDIADVVRGDIIVFRENKWSSSLVTHRAIEKVYENNTVYIKTKGDSNRHIDSEMVGENVLMGRVIYSIPKAGHVFAFAKTPLGMFALNFILAFLVLLLVIDKVKATERSTRTFDDEEMINHPIHRNDSESLECG